MRAFLLLILVAVVSVGATHCEPYTVAVNSTGAFERAFEVRVEPAGYHVIVRVTDVDTPGYNTGSGHVILGGVLTEECRPLYPFWHMGVMHITQTSNTEPPIVNHIWAEIGLNVTSDTGDVLVYYVAEDETMGEWSEFPNLYPLDFATQYLAYFLE